MRFLAIAAVAAFLALSGLGGFSAVHAQDNTTPGVTVSDAANTTPDTADAVVVQAESGSPTDISSNTTVVIPAGNWLDSILANAGEAVGIIIAVIFAWLARNLPAGVVQFLRTMQAEQLLARAAEFGINATRGAVKGKALEFDVGNEAIANGLQYAVDNAPKWLVDWLGGPEGIRQKIIARIPLGESVGSDNLDR